MPSQIIITPQQATNILRTGSDKAEGIVIELSILQGILGTDTHDGVARLFQQLPKNAALRFTTAESPGDSDTITFSKKALYNIEDGVEPPPIPSRQP